MLQKKTQKKYCPIWLGILDYFYRMLIVRGSGSGKTNLLLSLINHNLYTDKIYLFAKYPDEAKY